MVYFEIISEMILCKYIVAIQYFELESKNIFCQNVKMMDFNNVMSREENIEIHISVDQVDNIPSGVNQADVYDRSVIHCEKMICAH